MTSFAVHYGQNKIKSILPLALPFLRKTVKNIYILPQIQFN